MGRGLFEAGNAEDLAQKIAQLADSPDRRMEIAAAGRLRVEREFTSEHQAHRLSAPFERRIQRAAPGQDVPRP
ncbi:MAG: glycosyltransferase [Beggiatoa sp.]|nr:glycosyltransferase [Beggiatoa sp.]